MSKIDKQLDAAAKLLADHVNAGGTFTVEVAPCPKCGSKNRYRSNPSPNWMNRFTCPDCGRHVSR